jgi:hypothetical protein
MEIKDNKETDIESDIKSDIKTDDKNQQIITKPEPYVFKLLQFFSFDDAYKHYNINPKTFNIKVIDHPNSLESIYSNGNIITIVGYGVKSAPGYPSGNQNLDRQMQLINHFNTIGTIDVFYQNYNKRVIYMGRYGFLSYRKKLTHAGFAYFEFVLSSFQPRDRYKVFEKPNIPLV